MSAAKKLPPAILLMGPTASGKTGVAVKMVQHLPCEIISVDSALVYRHMNIGTAKPNTALLAQAPHHLIDVIEPTERYSAAQFRADALRLMGEITARGSIPLLTGGTMLYFKALQHGLSDLPQADLQTRAELDAQALALGWPAMHEQLARIDPITAQRLEPADSQRIQRALEIYRLTGIPMSHLVGRQNVAAFPYHAIAVALQPSDRAILHQRIAQRFDAMLAHGLIEEVQWLRTHYELSLSLPSMRCVGYRQVWQYLDGECDIATLRETGNAATRQLAKRQLTWLRSTPDVREFDCLAENLAQKVLDYLKGQLTPD